ATTTQKSNICIHNNEWYADGAQIPKEKPCESCYCMKGHIVCAVQECAPTPLEKINCTALPPSEGECCPHLYECDNISEEGLLTTEISLEASTNGPTKDLHGMTFIPIDSTISSQNSHSSSSESANESEQTTEENNDSGDITTISFVPMDLSKDQSSMATESSSVIASSSEEDISLHTTVTETSDEAYHRPGIPSESQVTTTSSGEDDSTATHKQIENKITESIESGSTENHYDIESSTGHTTSIEGSTKSESEQTTLNSDQSTLDGINSVHSTINLAPSEVNEIPKKHYKEDGTENSPSVSSQTEESMEILEKESTPTVNPSNLGESSSEASVTSQEDASSGTTVGSIKVQETTESAQLEQQTNKKDLLSENSAQPGTVHLQPDELEATTKISELENEITQNIETTALPQFISSEEPQSTKIHEAGETSGSTAYDISTEGVNQSSTESQESVVTNGSSESEGASETSTESKQSEERVPELTPTKISELEITTARQEEESSKSNEFEESTHKNTQSNEEAAESTESSVQQTQKEMEKESESEQTQENSTSEQPKSSLSETTESHESDESVTKSGNPLRKRIYTHQPSHTKHLKNPQKLGIQLSMILMNLRNQFNQ
ncbi:hypothetical protein HHI36_006887, partial [Cryptolaemus montrouzieri]